jgi:hypothetical protein
MRRSINAVVVVVLLLIGVPEPAEAGKGMQDELGRAPGRSTTSTTCGLGEVVALVLETGAGLSALLNPTRQNAAHVFATSNCATGESHNVSDIHIALAT